MAVDDSAYNLFTIKLLLSSLDHIDVTLTTALNGQLAVNLVRAAKEPFDFILMDL